MGTSCSCLIGNGLKEKKADILIDSMVNENLSN